MDKLHEAITSDLSDFRSQTCYVSGEVPNVGYNVGRVESKAIQTGRLLATRQLLFRHEVLRGMNVRQSTFDLMCMIDTLTGRKNLYVSASEIFDNGYYRRFGYGVKTVFNALSPLIGTGYVRQSSRDAYCGGKAVVCWGLTGKGKALLREYYAYLGGEHDDKLFR